MNTVLLSLLSSLIGQFGTEFKFDVAVWPIFAVGIVFILAVGAGIFFLIIFAVKFLKRIRNKNSNNV